MQVTFDLPILNVSAHIFYTFTQSISLVDKVFEIWQDIVYSITVNM